MRKSGGKKQTQEHNGKERERRGEREEVKMREEGTNQQGEVMKIICFEKTQKNAVASGKSAFHIAKIQKILRFPAKKGLIV